MNLEFPGEKIFLHEVEAIGVVWVAKGINGDIHHLELDDTGYSLPVWSHKDRVISYLHNARLIRSTYEPYAVPLDVFMQAWLSNKMLNISELLINLDGLSTRGLVLTLDEFRDSQMFLKAS
jgi:hypothetical protein